MTDTTAIKKGRSWWKYLLVLVLFPIATPYFIWKHKHLNVVVRILLILNVWFISLLVYVMTQVNEEALKEVEIRRNKAKGIQEITQQPSDIPFTQQEVTEEMIKKEAQTFSANLIFSKDQLRDVEISSDPDSLDDLKKDPNGLKYRVTLKYDGSSTWDERQLVRQTAATTVEASKHLFAHPKIGKVSVISTADFQDAYGKSSTMNAVRFTLYRETAEKLDWERFHTMVVTDYKKLIAIADETWMHPPVQRNLK